MNENTMSFQADEIFEIAQQIERNGAAFYTRAAKGAAGEQREMLLRLAGMEEKHLRRFGELRRQWTGGPGGWSDPDGDAARYLRALAAGRVFDLRVDPAEQIRPDTAVRDILQTALELEKDSVVFYSAMRELVDAGEQRRSVEEIIGQELGHIAELTDTLAGLD